MRITAAGAAQRRPRRSHLDHLSRPAHHPRRGELAAALAAVAVVAQLALAPVILLVAGLLVVTGRIARWRPAWLLLPALGGICWLAVTGLPGTAHALAAGASRLIAAELAVARQPDRLLHLAAALSGSGRWLPQELPLLVLAGTAEAAVVLWLGAALRRGGVRWSPSGWQPLPGGQPLPGWRAGLVATPRRRAAAAALAAGHTVTADGCAIGVDYYSGRLAAISWAQAERGVLLTGSDPAELGQLGLAITCAALRLRKAVLVLDLGTEATRDASVARPVTRLADRLSVPVTEIGGLADRSDAVCVSAAVGSAIRRRSVVLVSANQPEAARQAVAGLAGALMSLSELGLRGDCLAWLGGCEAADAACLSDLLALGPATGTAVLLSSTSPRVAADMAADAGVVVACGPIANDLAERLAGPVTAEQAAADILRRQRQGSAMTITRQDTSGPASFLLVPVVVPEVR